ncbi:hypothetical protein BD779DRAFT_1447229 [Infundibulicybe gibba]|nr:hypothetical protein BD779DRAFT_1447229 [Infundibulicybe gibba]
MPKPRIEIDVAMLAGLAAEGVLLGIFLVLDIAALYILVRRRGGYHRSVNKPMTLAAAVMFLLSMTQFVVDTAYIFSGFIALANSDPTRTTRQKYFSDLTQPLYAARHAVYFTMMLVGDAIVVKYRCYIVWNCNVKIVVIPILCSLGSAACAYRTIWGIQHFVLTPTFATLEHNMGFAIFSLSFAANTIATSLIAYKIWRADQRQRKITSTTSQTSARHSLLPIARIIVESGAINTAYLLTYVVILQYNSNGIQIMASITPLVGVIFTMVIIRAALASGKKHLST